MDSLIALGSTASTVYGIYGLYRIAVFLGQGDVAAANAAVAAMAASIESMFFFIVLIPF